MLRLHQTYQAQSLYPTGQPGIRTANKNSSNNMHDDDDLSRRYGIHDPPARQYECAIVFRLVRRMALLLSARRVSNVHINDSACVGTSEAS